MMYVLKVAGYLSYSRGFGLVGLRSSYYEKQGSVEMLRRISLLHAEG